MMRMAFALMRQLLVGSWIDKDTEWSSDQVKIRHVIFSAPPPLPAEGEALEIELMINYATMMFPDWETHLGVGRV